MTKLASDQTVLEINPLQATPVSASSVTIAELITWSPSDSNSPQGMALLQLLHIYLRISILLLNVNCLLYMNKSITLQILHALATEIYILLRLSYPVIQGKNGVPKL